jgi:hypothetical protein
METDQVRSIFAVGENHPLNPQSPVDFASYEGIEAFLPSSPSSVLEVQLVKSVGEKVIIEPNAASLLQKRTCCESSVFRPISCDEGSIKEDIARASKDPDDQRLMSYSDDDSAGGENENDLLGLQFLTDEKKKEPSLILATCKTL